MIVPAGTFLTGVIHIKSNVEISLAENAVWLGSAKCADYGPKDASPLIVSKGQHNFSITGKGTIDGNGEELIKDCRTPHHNELPLSNSKFRTEIPHRFVYVKPEFQQQIWKILSFQPVHPYKSGEFSS